MTNPTVRKVFRGWTEQDIVVIGLTVLSAAGGWLANVAPTGTPIWDGILTATFAALVAAATSAAKRWSWLPIAFAATLLPGLSVWSVFGLAGLAVAASAYVTDGKRNRMAGAFVGAASIQALLRADERGFFGFNTIVVAVVTLLVFWVGYETSTRITRRNCRYALAATALMLVVVGLGVGAAVAGGKTRAERGISSARNGLASARQGDQPESVAQLAAAEAAFEDAAGSFGAFFVKPALLVPIVAQHVRSLQVASAEGAGLAGAARIVAADADVQKLRPIDGRMDLSLLTSMAINLTVANERMGSANIALAKSDNRWLVPQLRDQVTELRVELSEAAAETDLASEALEVLPRMLGADRPMRYFVIFATPAESRELGGLLGAYAVLEANAGKIQLVDVGNSNALIPLANQGSMNDPTVYPNRFNEYQLHKFPMNIPGTPDPMTVLAATADLLPQLAGAPIDAMIYMDPFATAAFIGLVGEVNVEGLDMALDESNTADFLLEGQYARFAERSDRQAFLVDLLQQTFQRLLSAQLPGPEVLGARLGPAARQGRLQVATFDSEMNDFLRRIFLLRDFPRPDGRDFLAVVQTNGAPTKLDTYLKRSVDYTVEMLSESGDLRAWVNIKLGYDPPVDAPEYVVGPFEGDFRGLPRGSTRTLLSIYTPHEMQSLTVNGESLAANNQFEYGYWRHLTTIDLAPGESADLEFQLEGTIDVSSGYWLTMPNQPLIHDDDVVVTLVPPEGWRVGSGEPSTASTTSFTLTEDQRFGWPLNR